MKSNNDVQTRLERITSIIKFYQDLDILISPDLIEVGQYFYNPRIDEVFTVLGMVYNQGILEKVHCKIAVSSNRNIVLSEQSWIDQAIVVLDPGRFILTRAEIIRCIPLPTCLNG